MLKIGSFGIDVINYKSTVIYYLKRASHLDFISNVTVENSEWTVGIITGSKAIYASTKNYFDTEEKRFNFSYLAIQRFLDRLVLVKKPALAIENDKDKQVSLLITNENSRKTLNIFAKDFQKFEIGLEYEIRDMEGNILTKTSPINEYKPSVRYFRMSQLAEGLLDAYRYLYLAVESSLNDFFPKTRRDRERTWIGKAVNLANSKSKAPLTCKQYTSFDEYFKKYHYDQFRLKLFHSKENILLPLDHYDLTSIYNAYIDLFDICAMIFEVQYGFNIKGGSQFTEHAIKLAVEGVIVNEVEFFKNNKSKGNFFIIKNIKQFSATGYKGHLKIELDILSKQKSSFDRYEIRLDEVVYINLDFDEKIELEGYDSLVLNHEIMFTNRNAIDRPFLW